MTRIVITWAGSYVATKVVPPPSFKPEDRTMMTKKARPRKLEKGRASVAAERAAWLRDHPGNPLPEHICSLSEAEAAEYDRWLDERRNQPLHGGR
jgi:hypothetical protein